MPSRSKNNFKIINDEIFITRDEWSITAIAPYREDYVNEIQSYTWGMDNNEYLKCNKYGYLHKFIMEKWYGVDVVADMYEKGYVIDHLNNEHFDCRLSNLEFLKKTYNTAKGQAFDVDSKNMQTHIAVCIFKDFSTNCYQITIGCNDTIIQIAEDGTRYLINSIKLLYDCDYSIVVNDAENILRIYETEGIILYEKTHACDIKIERAIDINLTDEEKEQTFIFRDGEPYLVLGNGLSFINAVHYEKGWEPPKKSNDIE